MAAQPPAYASARALRAESGERLLARAFPHNIFEEVPVSSKPAGAPRRVRGPDLPPPSTGGEAACALQTTRPPGKIAVQQLLGEGIYDNEVVPKLAECEAAAAAVAAGKTPPVVKPLRIPAARRPAWTHGKIFSCADPTDCIEVTRSTRDDAFPGRRQVDRAAYRQLAEGMGWREVDAAIVDQAGEGGIEIPTDCADDIVIAWHHVGFVKHIDAATEVLDANMDDEWITEPTPHLPQVPCRVNPRNVVLQWKARVLADGKTVEHYLKARVTSNTSYGGAESVNGGISSADTYVALPTVQQLGTGLAIVQAATDISTPIPGYDDVVERAMGSYQPDGEEYDGVGGYAVDATSAYSFLVVQRLHHHLQCFCWWRGRRTASGERPFKPGISMSMRLEFGGASAPQSFSRAIAPVGASAQRRQAAFDAEQPPPPRIRAWEAYRCGLQQAGELPPEPEQRRPRHLQLFIDDGNGGALKDRVRPPAEVRQLAISAAPTEAFGGCFAPTDCRLYVHACMYILELRRVGFEDAPQKTVIGDPFGSLGFKVGVAAGRIQITDQRRAVILDSIAEQRARASAAEPHVICADALTLTSKLNHVAQVEPAIKPALHGGYRVAKGRWSEGSAARGWRQRAVHEVRLARGSQAHRGWLDLLDVGQRVLQISAGVPLACEAAFIGRGAAGVYTSTTDASGVDGVGGYVWVAQEVVDQEGRRPMWLVSERWPVRIQAALTAAATTGEQRVALRAASAPMLGMPAAELFGCIAVPAAVNAARGCERAVAVYAVGDCQPAAARLNAGGGGTPQMRSVAGHAEAVAEQWLGVAVRREENTDADVLSHPERALEVARRAAAAGFRVVEARVPQAQWDGLWLAAELGVGRLEYAASERQEPTPPVAGAKRTREHEPHTMEEDAGGGGGPSADDGGGASGGGREPSRCGVALGLFSDDPWQDAVGEARGSRTVALVVFDPDDRQHGLPSQLRRAGFDTVAVDTKLGRAEHDVRRREVQQRIHEWLHALCIAFLFLAVPCESFSIAHRPQLRSRRQADGIQPSPRGWERYLVKHNALARWACELAMLAHDLHVPWAIENPAFRGDKLSPAYWERMADHGALERFSAMCELRAYTSLQQATFAQCSIPDGAEVQKYTTLFYSAGLEAGLGGLRTCRCNHERHSTVAHGRDAHGRGRAELAAAYPLGLSRWIAEAAARAARAARAAEGV